MVQNDPGQQTPIRQNAPEQADPKRRARTPLPVDDVSPPADPAKGRNPVMQSPPFKGL